MNKEFQTHKLNEVGLTEAGVIAQRFDSLLTDLSAICMTSTREFSLCKTKLEEACFYAKKAMANNPAHCVPEEKENA